MSDFDCMDDPRVLPLVLMAMRSKPSAFAAELDHPTDYERVVSLELSQEAAEQVEAMVPHFGDALVCAGRILQGERGYDKYGIHVGAAVRILVQMISELPDPAKSNMADRVLCTLLEKHPPEDSVGFARQITPFIHVAKLPSWRIFAEQFSKMVMA